MVLMLNPPAFIRIHMGMISGLSSPCAEAQVSCVEWQGDCIIPCTADHLQVTWYYCDAIINTVTVAHSIACQGEKRLTMLSIDTNFSLNSFNLQLVESINSEALNTEGPLY